MSPGAQWGLMAAGAILLGAAVEAAPSVGVPLTGLVVAVMLLQWKGA